MKKKFTPVFLILLLFYPPALLNAQEAPPFIIQGIPEIHIDLPEDAIITKEEKVTATMHITNANGSAYPSENLYNGLIEIKGRGNSTWGMPKKPFSVDLVDENGEENPSSLLGMPEDEEWALIASYSDKSLLRIPIAYYLGQAIGMDYAPRTRFVEVYLNGNYEGLYSLCEKIKRADERVNLKKLTADSEDQAEPRISGGYLMEITPSDRIEADEKFITSTKGLNFVFKYPKSKNVTDQQMEWLRQHINQFEAVLYGANFKDEENGYRKYIDVDSFIDWFIVNELGKNNDAIFYSSVFLYKNRNEKLKLGPLWDFDIAFGNANYNHSYDEDQFWVKTAKWMSRLFEDEYFAKKTKERYTALLPALRTLPESLRDAGQYLQETGAIERNFGKWPILGTYVWPNYAPFPKTYEGEIRRLTDWLQERTDWLHIYLSTTEQQFCEALESTKPHISITDVDEYTEGTVTRIKTTKGYNKYYWNGVESDSNTITIQEGGKYWVQVGSANGCMSPVSDTLHFIALAKIFFDTASVFIYDGTAKAITATTQPEGLSMAFVYNNDTSLPVIPGDYNVKTSINDPYYKGEAYTDLTILKAQQSIIDETTPSVVPGTEVTPINVRSSSGLSVQYEIVEGSANINNGYLYTSDPGEVVIRAIQPGNELYQASDTVYIKITVEHPQYEKNIRVFPNPVQHMAQVQYPYAEKTILQIHDINGKIIASYILTGNSSSINVQSLHRGTYFLSFSSTRGKSVRTLIKY